MINDVGGKTSDNIFVLIKQLEGLKLNVVEPRISKISICSFNEDQYFRSSSIDYFRGSNLSINLESVDYFNESKKKMFSKTQFCANDFKISSTIGFGAYSKVVKAKHKKTEETFAIKVIDKHFMEKERKYYQIHLENELLNMCESPNIVQIYGAYEDEFSIYLVLEYCSKGNLSEYIEKNGPLSVPITQYIIAQIVMMVEYLNSLNIIHRDLKPDNILVDNKFILKLADFATAALKGNVYDEDRLYFVDETVYLKGVKLTNEDENKNEKSDDSEDTDGINKSMESEISKSLSPKISKDLSASISESSSKNVSPVRRPLKNNIFDLEGKHKLAVYKKQRFVGTAEYMAPEVIQSKEIGVYTDLWALGCIIYQCFMGRSPFADKTEYLTFQNILSLNYTIDNKKVPPLARDLIQSLLKLDPKERLGSGLTEGNSLEELKKHKFFNSFDSKTYMDILGTFTDNKKQILFETNITPQTEQKTDTTIKIDNDEKKEVILKSGELKKQSPWFFYDKRKLILYNTPRLDYIDPTTNVVKGSIPLTEECEAVLTATSKFTLKTPSRDFCFMCKPKFDITPWVDAINEAIEKYA